MQAGTGSIAGHIYNGDHSALLTENAWVTPTDAHTNYQYPSISVDEFGSYQATGLTPGDYIIEASGDGLAKEFYDEAGADGSHATVLTVTADTEISDIDFTLDPAGTISGVVEDSESNLLYGIRIEAEGAWVGACTDENGAYTLTNLPRNVPIKVRAGDINAGNPCPGPASSVGYLQSWWQAASSSDAATPVTMTDVQPDVPDIDFTLDLAGSISGHVYESDGTTPVSEPVRIEVDVFSTNQFVTTVDVDILDGGSYQVIGLQAGQYRLGAAGGSYAQEFYDNAGAAFEGATPVDVTTGLDTPNIDFTLDPGGTISGMIYAEDGVTPLPHMPVYSHLESDHQDAINACTDNSGHYTLRNVPLNTGMVVEAGGSFNWCGGSAAYGETWWVHEALINNATPVTLSLAERDVDGIDIWLELLGPTGTISGTVYQADGVTPIANMGVDIAQGGMGTCTDENGDYTLNLPFGDYQIRAGANNFCGEPNNFVNQYWQYVDDLNLATTITLDLATPDVSAIDFKLDQGGSVSGIVYKEDGTTPIPISTSIPISSAMASAPALMATAVSPFRACPPTPI